MNEGLKEGSTQLEIPMEGIGEGYINLKKGSENLVLELPLYESPGENPISLSLYYNHQNKNENNEYGKGMRISLYTCIEDYESRMEVKLADGSGSAYEKIEEYRYQNKKNQSEIKKIITNTDGDSDKIHYELSDRYKNTTVFGEDGGIYPEQFKNINGETVTVEGNTVNNHRKNTVEIQKESGLVKILSCKTNGKEHLQISFTYTEGLLQKIRWERITDEEKALQKELHLTYETEALTLSLYPQDITYRYTLENTQVKTVEEQNRLLYTVVYKNNRTDITDTNERITSYFFTTGGNLSYIRREKTVSGFSFTENGLLKTKTNPFVLGKEQSRLTPFSFHIEDGDEEIIKSEAPDELKQLGLENEYRIRQGTRLTYTYGKHRIEGESISILLFGKTEDAGSLLNLKVLGREAILENAGNEYGFAAMGITVDEELKTIPIELDITGDIRITDILIYEAPYGSIYEYNDSGLLIKEETDGTDITYTYDERQYLTKIQSGGLEKTVETDEKGQITKIVQPDGSYVHFLYDENHQLSGKRYVSPASDSLICEDYTYDEIGNPVQSTDGLGQTQAAAYTADGLVSKETDKAGYTTEYEYRPDGTISKILKGQEAVSYTYDGKKRLSAVGLSNQAQYQYTYDTDNRLTKITLNGITAEEYAYNTHNALTEIKTNGKPTALYTYEKGKLVGIESAGISTELRYDEDDKITDIIGKDVNTAYTYTGNTLKEITVTDKQKNIKQNLYYTFNRYGEKTAVSRITEGKKQIQTYDSRHQTYRYGGGMYEKSTHCYTIPEELISRMHIYPLSNDVVGIEGEAPVAYNGYRYKENALANSFAYNSELKRCTYRPMRAGLQYSKAPEESGSLYVRFIPYASATEKNIIELNNSNARLNLGVYIALDNTLVLTYNQSEYRLNHYIKPDEWHHIVLAYEFTEEESVNSEEDPLLWYTVTVEADNFRTVKTFSASTAFYNMTLTLGNNQKNTRGFTGEMELLLMKEGSLSAGVLDKYKEIKIETYTNQYDSFNRLSGKSISTAYGEIHRQELQYKTNGIKQTVLPEKETITLKQEINERSYETDENGKITSIRDTLFGSHTYTYDGLGRLIKEDNLSYTYDAGGNLLSIGARKLEYDTVIKDRLIRADGKAITYDGLYPVSYNGMSFSYTAGRLENIEYQADTAACYHIRYEYNAYGLRTKKTVQREYEDDRNSTQTEYRYYYEGEKLICEVCDLYRNDYLYDAEGSLYGFIHNGNTYYYVRDILKNILGILDESGNLVVKYTYDAYGTYQGITGSLATSIGEINPFRYKGYYYDRETGFFYTKTRYYVGSLGRFLTPDKLKYLEPFSFNGLNLYAYCGNDPINYYDPTGHFGILALVAITVASMLIGGTAQLVSNALAGKTGNELWRGVAGAAIGAGVNSLALCLAIPTGGASLFIAAGASAIAQTGVDTLETVIRGEGVNVGQTFIDLGLNFVTTLAGNYLGGKMIPTNPGWFQPQKFLSVFTKSYGQKILLQTAIGASLSGTVNFIRKNDWSKYKPVVTVPMVPLYPLF